MSFTVESIQAQEDACVLPAFDSDVAWELGTIIRTKCRQRDASPVVVCIAHANSSQLLFFATSGPGTQPDSMHWVRRKEAVVLRWGVSSLRMWLQVERQYGSIERSFQARCDVADASVYACHGGGFPVRVKNVEGLVGVIVVSGSYHVDDHDVIVDGIQEYLKFKRAD